MRGGGILHNQSRLMQIATSKIRYSSRFTNIPTILALTIARDHESICVFPLIFTFNLI